MGQLEGVFERHVGGGGVSGEQLQTLYLYVQAAVDGGEVHRVVSTLHNRLARINSQG
jgi:hypothetical protein